MTGSIIEIQNFNSIQNTHFIIQFLKFKIWTIICVTCSHKMRDKSKSSNQIHVAHNLNFKMIYQGALFGVQNFFSLRNSFVFYCFLICSVNHCFFHSLATCCLFSDNRSCICLTTWKLKIFLYLYTPLLSDFRVI